MEKYYTLAEGNSLLKLFFIYQPVNNLLGCPYANNASSVQLRSSTGRGGLVLMQDTQLLETLAHFNRERIPER